jgi:ribosomal protein L13E
VVGWEARRYRPGSRQNQRFGRGFGMKVVPATGLSGNR